MVEYRLTEIRTGGGKQMEGKNPQESRLDDDEIDIYEIFLVLKKRFRLILGVFLLGIALAAGVSFLQSPVYESDFLMRASVLSPSETVKIIDRLDGLLEEGDYEDVSSMLNVRSRDVVSLRAEDSSKNEENWVDVTLDVRDPSLIRPLKDNVLRYLNENDYVRERVDLERESRLNLRSEILARLSKIENLSNEVINHIEKGRMKDVGFNPIGLDKGIIDLKQRLKDVENEIQLLKGFEAVTEPIMPDRPARPRKALNIAVGGTASLFVGIFLALVFEWLEGNRGRSREERGEASETPGHRDR
ncbi:MAG: Wzz/FepE/Etk N-terminal domain-containing protein [Nitrospirota bacterium]